MTARDMAIGAFLAACGWGTARRQALAGDASARRYLRLWRGDGSAVLMDNPPGGADDPAAFARMAGHLTGLGLSAPRVLAADLAQGFLLLEDLGDAVFARLLHDDPAPEPALYAVATDVLVHLAGHPAPPGLPDVAAQDWAAAAAMVLDVYAGTATGTAPDATAFVDVLAGALTRHAEGPRVLILRDYHAENLIWLPGRDGLARAGLLDFQLGQMGQPGYDLVSLVQDARRDVAPETARAMQLRYADAMGLTDPGARVAVLGAQRALRIIGVFARLCVVAGKPGYLALIPRVWGQLQENLAHPALAALAPICARLLPPPTPAVLERIARQCSPMP